MKQKFITSIFQCTIVLVMLFSCTKIDFPLVLPAETQTGANTFGCLVNGEVWRVKTDKEKRKGFEEGVTALIQDSLLYIGASDLGTDDIANYSIGIFVNLKSINRPFSTADTINYLDLHDYTRGDKWGWFSSCRDCYSCTTCPGYPGPDQKDSGIITVTRLDEKIVSGRFEGKLLSYLGGSAILTEGRFDIKLK